MSRRRIIYALIKKANEIRLTHIVANLYVLAIARITRLIYGFKRDPRHIYMKLRATLRVIRHKANHMRQTYIDDRAVKHDMDTISTWNTRVNIDKIRAMLP